jgi:hypothetical protein
MIPVMARKKIPEGPIGKGWVEEVRTEDGLKFVARWQFYVADPDAPEGRRRESVRSAPFGENGNACEAKPDTPDTKL